MSTAASSRSCHRLRFALVIGLSAVAPWFAGACGESKSSALTGSGGAGGSVGGTVGSLGGAGGSVGGAGGSVGAGRMLAIVSSDYATARVSLYRPADGHLVDACTGSTATDPGLKQPLSSDLMLPSQPQAGGELVLIDSSSSVLSFLDPMTCAARRQLSVSTGGFKAFPHDVVIVSAHKAYVTRSAKNDKATVDPADFDDGDDVLIVDPTDLTVLGRIALATYAAPGPTGEVTQARPDRAVLVGTTVYVTLNSISAKYDATGEGRLVAIDTVTDTVTGMVALPDQKNCSGVTYVAATQHLYVSCGGAFSDLDQAGKSALVEIDVAVQPAVVSKTIAASTLGLQPLNFAYNAVFGDSVFVGTMGVIGNPKFGTVDVPDAFYRVSLSTGTATKVQEGTAFKLGSAAVDPLTGVVFLPDADAAAPRVHVLPAAGAVAATTGFEPNPSAHLPPRALGWY